MKNKTNNTDTALIGCGYWGTNIARSFLRYSLYSLGFLSFILTTLALLIQVLNVKENLVKSFVADLSEKTHYSIKIESVSINWLDRSHISQIQVFDLNQNLMVVLEDVEIDFDLSKCLFIFSYNDESKVNPILKDRMYRIETQGYESPQKLIIANRLYSKKF